MKKLLITGGAGFIGSHFIKYIIDNHPDYTVINVDNLTYAGNLDNLKSIESNERYSFIKTDICDAISINELMSQGIDYVINFAAESHVDRSIIDSSQFINTNVLGTNTLLEAAKTYGIKKFIQISTDEVYGSLGHEGVFTEESPLAPNSPYSASKASADLMVRSYYQTFGLPVNITRCSNNYGSHQLPEKLIPLMICNAYEDQSLPLYGTGLNIRDWIHVKDHCRAIFQVLCKGKNGEIYNVGANNERTNKDIVMSILRALNKTESLITLVEDRLGHDYRYAISYDKIREQVGWQPEIDFEEGLQEVIGWYLENMEWCKETRRRLKTYYKCIYG
ncbi:dTDP-glucose 4,6-dehydratase [Vallitalea okinawensis]|uniref:dTDP-glucose 4,6-dehydratase n=1 Tax=Vallitalea okinawensis TaxID=2078660 RepID=UPI000CFB3A6F|nr:dTDP-glucose 4,6-dehydratase [Vallitalea okinawensis]